MSLTKQDLGDIRDVVLEAIDVAVSPRLDRLEAIAEEHTRLLQEHSRQLHEHGEILRDHGQRLTNLETKVDRVERKVDHLEGEIKALYADVKELHRITGELERHIMSETRFAKLSTEQKLRRLYTDIMALARHLGVTL